MTLQEIKDKLGMSQLNFNKSESKPEWFNCFDTENRRSIGIHKDTVDKLSSGESLNLGLTEPTTMITKEGKNKGEEYELIHIVAYTPADLVL